MSETAPTTRSARWLGRYADLVLRHPRLTIAINVIVATALALNALTIQFETAPDIWFLPGDPTLLAHQELEERFGSDRWVVVAFEARAGEDIVTNEALGTIARVTQALDEMPHVLRVRSLSSFERVRGADGLLETEPLFAPDALPLEPDELAALRAAILDEPIAQGLIVAEDLGAAAVVGELDPETEDLTTTVRIVDALYEIADAESARSGLDLVVAGGPVVEWAFVTASIQDNQRLVPALYAFIALVLFGVLRRPLGVGYALAVVVLATGATLGAFSMAGLHFNNLSAMLPMILLAVSVANGVHVLVAFYAELGRGSTRPVAARRAVVDLFAPCFLSSFTTAVGFATLLSSAMPPLRQYGLFAAIGVLASFAIALSFLPAALSLGRTRADRPAAPLAREGGWIGATLALLGGTAGRHPWPVSILGLALTIGAVAASSLIRVESDALEYFRPEHIARQGTERVQDFLGGVANLEIIVRGDVDGAIKDPALLEEIADLQRFLDDIPEVTKTISLADFVTRLNRSLNDEDPAAAVIPDSREGVAQLLLLYGMADPEEDLSGIVDYPYRNTRVTARLPFRSSWRTSVIVAEVNADLATRFAALPGIEATLTGVKVLYNRMQDYVFETFVKSFGLALLVITVTITIALRSVRLGLLSMVPNVMPIVWILGVMGLTGIPLNVGTALVASVTLGIAVDDTIHFLARFAEARRAGDDVTEATRHVFEHSGRAILTTSLILMGGFWTLVFAQFLPMVYLGLITGITIAFALLADLLLLPALLRLILGSRS